MLEVLSVKVASAYAAFPASLFQEHDESSSQNPCILSQRSRFSVVVPAVWARSLEKLKEEVFGPRVGLWVCRTVLGQVDSPGKWICKPCCSDIARKSRHV